MKAATTRHVGVTIHPHGFRHIAAARYLAAYPDEWEAVAQLLGHTDPATAKRHYTIINNKRVFECYDALDSPPRAPKAATRRSKAPAPPSPNRRRAKGGSR